MIMVVLLVRPQGLFGAAAARGRGRMTAVHRRQARWRPAVGAPGRRVASLLVACCVYPVINPWQPYPQGVLLLALPAGHPGGRAGTSSPGYAGYISLGHSMFLGLGAYTAAIIALHTGREPALGRAARRRGRGASSRC